MKKLIFILIINFSDFCIQTNIYNLLDLPGNMLENEILVENLLVPFLKEYFVSNDSNRLFRFFQNVTNIKLTNKYLSKILDKYLPGSMQQEPKFFPFESLLVVAAYKNWQKLYGLIFKNINTKNIDLNELNAALLFAAADNNITLFNELVEKGANEKFVDGIVKQVFEKSLNDLLQNGLDKKFLNFYLIKSMAVPYNKLIYYIVKLLLLNGAQADIKGGYALAGYPLLMVAFTKNDENLMRLLLSKIKKIDAVNAANLTTLMLAAIQGKNNIIKLLLDHGATINLQDDFGKTAIMHAVEHKKIDTVKLLLERGANKDIPNDKQQTPYEIALSRYKASRDLDYKAIMNFLID